MPRFVTTAFTAFVVLLVLVCLTAEPLAAQTRAESSFQLQRNQILLPVRIDGEGPFQVLLDTAGSPSAVDLATALEHGFPVDTTLSGEASGVGGERVRIFAAELPDVEIGGASFGDLDAVALDLSRISERMGRPIHGILGYGLLAGRIVQIDYPGRIVRFFEKALETDGWTIPLVFLEGDFQPLVDVTVNGHPVTVTLDTGSSLTLEVYPPGVERAGLGALASRATGEETAVGARGRIETPKAAVQEVAIGPYRFHDVEVAFTERDRYEEGREGNLGNGLLRHFVLTLDYPAERLTFEQPAHPPRLSPEDRVRIAEAYRFAERVAHPFWEGWQETPFPILLVDAEREFLVRHPDPPEEFERVGHDDLLGDIHARARTLPPRIGSVVPVGGLFTVAISTREILGVKSSTAWVLKVLHEHFHQYQLSDPSFMEEVATLAPARIDTTGRWSSDHPFPYDDPGVGKEFSRLTEALGDALEAVGTDSFPEALAEYRRTRCRFGSMLSEADEEFLAFQFWHEGIPAYLEYRLAALAAEGYESLPAFDELDDSVPYRDVARRLRRRIDAVSEYDLATHRRVTAYYVGSALGVLLDAGAPGWKGRYLAEKFDLDAYFSPAQAGACREPDRRAVPTSP